MAFFRSGIAALSAAMVVVVPALGDGPAVAAGDPRAETAQLRAMGLREGRVTSVGVARFGEGSPGLTVTVQIGAKDAPRVGVFDIDPYPLRSPDFKVMASGPDGVLREVPAPAPSSFHGKDRATGDELWASVVGMQVRGVVYPAGTTTPSVYIQPLEGGAAGEHVVYAPQDVVATGATCGLDDCEHCHTLSERVVGPRGPGCKYVEMIAEADYPYFQANQNSIGATVQDIEVVLLGVNAIYRNTGGFTSPVRFALKQVTVWTTNAADPYNAYPLTDASANNMIVTQATRWLGIASPARDVVHLFTGRDLNGSTVGLGYTPGFCSSSFQYSLVQSRFTTVLAARYADSAHELGHNFGLGHDAANGNIMGPGIDTMTPPTVFSAGSITTYNANIGGFTCMNNTYPDVLPDGAITLPGIPVTIDVLANDGQGVICTAAVTSFTLPSLTASLGGTLAISVGTGPGGRNQVVYTPPVGAGGIEDSFQYTAGGVNSTVHVTVVSPRQPDSPPSAVLAGLGATYYNITVNGGTQVQIYQTMQDFSGFPISGTGVATQLNYPPTTGAAVGSGRNFGVAAAFEGFIQAPVTGFYQFWLVSDDHSRLFIGNSMVVDNPSPQTTTEANGTIALAPGRHRLHVDYNQYSANSTLVMSWAYPGQARVTVPASRLWRASGLCHADYNGTGGVSVQDIFDFLNDWLAGLPRADFNGVDGLTVQDIFDFLSAWFGPC